MSDRRLCGTDVAPRSTPPGSLFSPLREALAVGRAQAIAWAIADEPPAHTLAAEVAAAKEPFDAAIQALVKIEQAARDAHKLADDFVMRRAGPWNYEPHYKVRAALSEVLGSAE